MIISWLNTDVVGKFLLIFFPFNDTADEMSKYFGEVLLFFVLCAHGMIHMTGLY